VPDIGDASTCRIREMPLFTRGLDGLDAAALEDVGVIGGPCLFGTDEMIIEIKHKNGEKHYYDFNSGRNYIETTEVNVAEHFSLFAEQIADVSFDSRKNKMTLQEYECLAYPMEIANLLNAPLVVPIPDMSYKKFLASISDHIDPVVKDKMLESFAQESYRIADMHMELFEKLLKKYPLRRYTILHSRDTDTLAQFYNEREEYFKLDRSKGNYTSRAGKEESVYDYISMIASPFYFWGTKNILQVDSIDEMSSMQKCAKVHGNTISIFSIMFPEILSKSGQETIFYAKMKDKIFIEI